MFLLGIPSGLGAFPEPREWTVSSNVSRVTMSARVTVGSPRGVITSGSGMSGFFYGGRGRLGGVARVSYFGGGVNGGDDIVVGVDGSRVGSGDFAV
jgi:hypothetical protein